MNASDALSTDYLDSLNEQQRLAVETTEGPLLVLAGAGTGKTQVLTFRIAHILRQKRAWPNQILAVTFTNKAAAEMRHRIIEIIGDQGKELSWLGTFHRIGVRVLRRHAEELGLRRDFTILDRGDQQGLLKRLIATHNIDSSRWPPQLLAGSIDRWKNRGLAPREIPEVDKNDYGGKGIALYQEYQDCLKGLNAVDFGDLLLEPYRLFLTRPDILADYQERFHYILVDEYQDTNIVQYLLLRLLARKWRNFCCVGDDDQSIYSWRGAQVGNILNFNTHFPEARTVRLEQNYRSTHHILNAASGLIAANGNRHPKKLWTSSKEGEKVIVRGAADSGEEARQIAGTIASTVAGGKRLDDIAVLVRVGAQMRELEECFLNFSIPYRVVGGPRFFERAEVRDVNAYLRLAHRDDDVALERIINCPRRGLGDGALEKLRALARTGNLSLFQAAIRLSEDGSGLRAKRRLQGFVELVEEWRKLLSDTAPSLLACRIVEDSGYRTMLRSSHSADAPGRLENLDELLRAIEPFSTLEEYLEHVALFLDADQQAPSNEVRLMTLHSAKGLEFDTVFLPGWEEGLFPHKRALEEGSKEGVDEERRLAYVGLTRAKRIACISFAVHRLLYGRWENATPSRFLKDLETMAKGALASGTAHERASRGDRMLSVGQRSISSEASRGIAGEHAPNSPGFEVGERVFHRKFGYGRVREQDGDRLCIDFEKTGEKKIIASFVEPAAQPAAAQA